MGRPTPVALPIDPLLPGIAASLRARGAVVIEAPPGAGRPRGFRRPCSTRALANGERSSCCNPAVCRRAWRPSGWPANGASEPARPWATPCVLPRRRPRTRIRFVTEGILLRRLLSEPTLPGVEVVILDEFHERHLASDLALALLRRLQLTARPDWAWWSCRRRWKRSRCAISRRLPAGAQRGSAV